MGWLELSEVKQALDALEEAWGHRVILMSARWHGDRGVNFGEEAAWKLRQVVEPLAQSPLSVVLYTRGGDALFAQDAHEILEGVELARCVVLGRINGAASVLPWMFSEVVMVPGASIGAPGAGVLGPTQGKWRADVLAKAPPVVWGMEDPARRQVLQIAQQMCEAQSLERVARHVLGLHLEEEVREEVLAAFEGARGLSLGSRALARCGFAAARRPEDQEERGLLMALRNACEGELGLKQFTHAPRFVELEELGGEVEFEMASSERAAVILGSQGGFVYEVDTGDPDADSGMLRGYWRQVEALD